MIEVKIKNNNEELLNEKDIIAVVCSVVTKDNEYLSVVKTECNTSDVLAMIDNIEDKTLLQLKKKVIQNVLLGD